VIRRGLAVVAALAVLPLVACASSDDDPVGLDTPSPVPRDGGSTNGGGGSTGGGPTGGEGSSGAAPSASATLPTVRHRPSLPVLMRAAYDGGRIRHLRTEATTDAYTRSQVTYRSGDLTVSGVLLRPHGKGPFPAIVLNHGYIDPGYYVTGQGLAREQDRLAREGFVVLHTDYRGHAASSPASELDMETRLGYARDAINAVHALRRLPYVDDDRLAMLGRSMGGGVTMDALVAQPGLVDAAVLYASVSSDFLDNLRRWTLPERPEEARALFDRFGRPGRADGFYEDLSPRTYFDRITEPVLMFHGTSDDSCPVRWSHTTHRLMRADGVDARLVVYPGEEHAFIPRWEDSIRQTVRFLRRQLDG